MDYYSEQAMPSVEQRTELLFNIAKKWNINISDDILKSNITEVVNESAEFSLTGYYIFGQKIDSEKLSKKLKIYK